MQSNLSPFVHLTEEGEKRRKERESEKFVECSSSLLFSTNSLLASIVGLSLSLPPQKGMEGGEEDRENGKILYTEEWFWRSSL